MNYYKYIKFTLIAIPAIFLGILLYKDFVPNGRLAVDYYFCQETPFVSQLSPHGRVLDIEKVKTDDDKYCQQKMVIDPVYFDVRLPQRFNEARLTIWYKKLPETKLQIGPAIDLSAWQWQLEDVGYIRSDNGWQVGAASYDISVSRLDNNRLRFLVSSPGLSTFGQEIIFKKMEIEFIKAPINNWVDFQNRLKDFLSASRLFQYLRSLVK